MAHRFPVISCLGFLTIEIKNLIHACDIPFEWHIDFWLYRVAFGILNYL